MKKEIRNGLAEIASSESGPTPSMDTIDAQSTRTTFNLSTDAQSALNWMAKNQGSIKKAFDLIASSLWKNDELTTKLADMEKKSELVDLENHTRKTYVIGTRSLRRIKNIARKHSVNRDGLVELSILFFKILIDKELKNYKKALELVSDLWQRSSKIIKELSKILEPDDPIIERMGTVDVVIMNLHEDIYSELEDGTPIDPEGL